MAHAESSLPRHYAIVTIEWAVDSALQLPVDRRFAATGYLKDLGWKGLVSVWCELLDWSGNANDSKSAKLFIASPHSQLNLPQKGEKFVLTSGVRPVAECLAIACGEEI